MCKGTIKRGEYKINSLIFIPEREYLRRSKAKSKSIKRGEYKINSLIFIPEREKTKPSPFTIFPNLKTIIDRGWKKSENEAHVILGDFAKCTCQSGIYLCKKC